MARFVVAPGGQVAGRLRVPGDKSISHRALMFAAIASGRTRVTGFLEGEDCLSTLQAVARLGVTVQRPSPGEVLVDGVGLQGLRAPQGVLDMVKALRARFPDVELVAGNVATPGATLALISALTHPERVAHLVLRGVFLLTKAELKGFYGGGAGAFFPEGFVSATAPAQSSLDL
jgi:hypothetical protein